MLLYKKEELSTNESSNYTYMINLIMEDYSNYFKASEYLQGRYDVCLQAIYSCLSQVNNYKSKSTGYKELSKLLESINKKSGIKMQIISKDKLYVKEKRRRRLVYY